MKRIYYAAAVSNLGMFAYGLCFGWASPSLPILLGNDSPVKITMDHAVWITSCHTIGGAIGTILSNFMINEIGRKWSLFFTSIPLIIGWMLIAFATSAWELMMGRVMYGLSTGYGYIAAITYMGEVSPANVRGQLTSWLTTYSKTGLFLNWTIGPFLSVRDLALVSASVAFLFLLSSLGIPESPYHLMRQGRNYDALASLAQLRGTELVSEEAAIIEKSVKIDLANDSGIKELVCISGNRKALIIVLCLVLIQQWSGSQAIVSYAELMLNETGSQLEGKFVIIILGGIQLMFTIITAMVVDRHGRRPLLMISSLGTSVSTFLVGLFFFLRSIEVDVSRITWLPALGVVLYVIAYSFGLAGLPFTVLSEVFPTNVKALGSTMGMFVCNSCAVFVTLSYQSIIDLWGLHAVFWLFSAVGLLGVVFVYVFVPETKGKTLQEVQAQLHGHKLL